MREILFRGKRNDDGGEWHYGGYIHDDSVEPDVHIIMEHRGGMFRCVPVLPETVGQFTGLYDSTKWDDLTEPEKSEWLKEHTESEWKGKRIFEGDIVEWIMRWEHNINGVKGIDNVIYKNNHFELEHEPPFLDLYGGEGFIAEVIGNIHDNPELLEVSVND